MNVLMVGVDKNRVGGMWTVADNFLNNAFLNKKINLTYVATATGGSAFRRIIKMLVAFAKIVKVLICDNIDIIHIHMAEKGSVFRKGIVIFIGRLFRKKIVVQMHAGPIIDWYKSCPLLVQKIIKRIFNASDCMLVLGEYWKAQLSELIPEKKIVVLYNGTDCPETNKYNVNGKGIVYLGLIKKTKGTYDLIDAISIIDDKLDSRFKVHLCGVDEDGEMENYIKGKSLEKRVLMRGWISKEERLSLFKDTRMVVLPSYFEALSMTVIESMCYGIPVVTTNISTMPELLGNSRILITPGDISGLAEQILEFATNDDYCKKISSDEYYRAQRNFSIDEISKKLLRIYEQFAAK